MAYLYPRLEKSQAILIAKELNNKSLAKFDDPHEFIDFGKAIPKATGGVPVSRERLQNLRSKVQEALSGIEGESHIGTWSEEYDRRLGKVLWDHLDMIPGDSGSAEVWNFLSLVVLPNACNARYPFADQDDAARHIGPIRRAYLKNLWVRRRIFGEKFDQGSDIFTDDLHFQITDRVVMRTTPVLCHAIIDYLSQFGTISRNFYRPLLREIQAISSYIPLALLSESEVRKIVGSMGDYVAELLGIATPTGQDLETRMAGTPLYLQMKADQWGETPANSSQDGRKNGIMKDPSNRNPAGLRSQFERFRETSSELEREALAKRDEPLDAKKWLDESARFDDQPVVDSDDEHVVVQFQADLVTPDEPETSHRSQKSNLTEKLEDVAYVNSFTLRMWRKIYSKLKVRELLDEDALSVFDSFFETKKASEPKAATLMMRCMATALESGIMMPEEVMFKIRR